VVSAHVLKATAARDLALAIETVLQSAPSRHFFLIVKLNHRATPAQGLALKETSASKMRVLIADDYADWRLKVREILNHSPQWQIIDAACNGTEAVEKATQLQIQLPSSQQMNTRSTTHECANNVPRLGRRRPDAVPLGADAKESEGVQRFELTDVTAKVATYEAFVQKTLA